MLDKVFNYILMPGERVLQSIEDTGIYVNKARLIELEQAYRLVKEDTSDRLRDILPPQYKDMNFNSPKQLSNLLFKELGLPIISKTASGDPSTGKSTLLRLVEHSDIPKLLLEYRRYNKALDGFLVPWQEYIARDGRLHSTYKIAHTQTGRLSAEDPNLQQVPRDGNVRSLIGATPGWVFIDADYSQIELRSAAFIANAYSMKVAYRNGMDLHSKTAASVSRVTESEVTKAMRTAAKAVNFGFLFGMWWKSFKEYAFDSYGVIFTDREAEDARNRYFETYPELLPWHDRQREEVRAFGYVKSPIGRVRHLPNIYSTDEGLRGQAERQSINTPVQSFASDMTLLAMILIDKNFKKLYPGRARLVGQVHDAILSECVEGLEVEVGTLVRNIMEGIPQVLGKYFGVHLDIPIEADVNIGPAWGVGEGLKR